MSERTSNEKAQLIAALDRLLNRELHARGSAFAEAVADRLGLTASDLKCLELVRHPPAGAAVTAGQLAEYTGLTTGAITGLIDRLERAGLVYREKDPSDRRQVRVRLTLTRSRELEQLLSARDEAWSQLCAPYSQAQLTLLAEFVRKAEHLMREQTERTRSLSHTGLTAPQPGKEQSAPLARLREGFVTFAQTPPGLVLSSLGGELLYRLRSDEPAPRVQRKQGRLTVSLPAFADDAVLPGAYACTLELAQGVPWSVTLQGGVANLRADLRAVELRGFEIDGGVSNSVLELPAVKGAAALRVTGGAHRLRLLRPRSTPVRLHIDRGASGLSLDGLQLAAVGGDVRWETPTYATASDRLDVILQGGASKLTLDVF